MKTPVEIAEEAIADTHDLDVRDIHYARAVICALEAAGYVIARPDQAMTREAMSKATVAWQQTGEIETMFAAALRAAPKWTKGSEG